MNKKLKEAYKKVIEDLKSNGHKCKDFCLYCSGCQEKRMAEDLKSILELDL